jgi:hypothetical protein
VKRKIKVKQKHKDSTLISGKKLYTLKERVSELEVEVRRLKETSHYL